MSRLTRRGFVKITSAAGAFLGVAASVSFKAHAADNGFQAAAGPGQKRKENAGPGLQSVTAVCEVTGGGQKVYAIAVEYDVAIDPADLSPDTFAASLFPAPKDYFPGMPQEPDKNATTEAATPRAIAAIYNNTAAALRSDRQSVKGPFVIAEFAHDADLSLPTTDSDRVTITQSKDVKTLAGTIYPAAPKVWSNAGDHGNAVAIRGVDDWGAKSLVAG